MNKILETHYNITNSSYQVRVIKEDFHEYTKHILETNGIESTKIINGIDNRQGCSLSKTEKIIKIIQNIEDRSFIFEKYNSFNQSKIIVSLVVIDES